MVGGNIGALEEISRFSTDGYTVTRYLNRAVNVVSAAVDCSCICKHCTPWKVSTVTIVGDDQFT